MTTASSDRPNGCEITIPRNTLVLLIGPAGSGKSTFAATHFRATQVVSSDECRALICDDPANQAVSGHAFKLMTFIIEKRLLLGKLTVADATNLSPNLRRRLIRLGRRYDSPLAAIAFDLPLEICRARNASRGRVVPGEALERQYKLLKTALKQVPQEGFDFLFILDEQSQLACSVRIGRRLSRQRRSPASAARRA